MGSEADAALTGREADLRGPIALVIGSEGHGLSPAIRRRCDLFVRIPMRGTIGSLNAAVAGSVLLFEVIGQHATLVSNAVGAPAAAPAAAPAKATRKGRATKASSAATAADAAPANEAPAADPADPADPAAADLLPEPAVPPRARRASKPRTPRA